jgi:glutamyl-tRNA synthetase
MEDAMPASTDANGFAGGAPVTRFAPSPTGYLHIGGARTALFNWLYSKRFGGTMQLRIEDTDRERYTKGAVDAILDGLTWLGLTWDGEAISQFERAPRHRDIAHQLVAAGKAYRCFASPAELDEMREAAKAEGRPPRYDGRWRDRPASEAPVGAPHAIRIKAPQGGETVIDDAVQGVVKFPNADLDDFIILRSDGNPTYMLAVVVDDHDMGVTQIIRGDDHLTNAARQQIIYDAMGWTAPKLAHIPLIHGADGAKLSKRHGALGIEEYRRMGYLPQALRNYLVRLGWSHGDDEIMSIDEMTAWFDIKDVNRGASRFDFAKLEALNGHYIRNSDDAELTDLLIATAPHLDSGPVIAKAATDEGRALLMKAMSGLKARARTLEELAASCFYLFAARPLAMDDKALELVAGAEPGIMAKARQRLAEVDEWNAASLELAIRTLSEETGLKLGKVAQPLRAALTGRATSPGLFEVMETIGRDESLARLSDHAG